MDLGRENITNWRLYCRQIFEEWLHKHSEKNWGPGKIVEIDEYAIGRRKYNVGRVPSQRRKTKWILGGIERDSNRVFVVPVEERSADVLLGIIKEKIAPGTTIVSDCWSSYNRIPELEGYNFQHLTVNHSKNFVDPETGACTNKVERFWREIKDNIPRYGRKGEHVESYLADIFLNGRSQ
jgi:transposase-like protein